MKYQQKIALSLLTVVVAMNLGGCANGMFRNRTFDYLRVPVNETAPLATPPGMTGPSTQPALKLPAGPSSYPAEAKPSVMLTPPDFNTPATNIVAQATPKSPVINSPSPVAVKPVPSDQKSTQTLAKPIASSAPVAPHLEKVAVEQKSVTSSSTTSAKSELGQTVSQANHALVAKTADSTQKVQTVKSMPITKPGSSNATAVTNASQAVPKPAAMPEAATTPTAMAAAIADTHKTAATEAKPSPSKPVSTKKAESLATLKTQLSFDSNNVGLLAVSAPMEVVFKRAASAIQNSRYTVSSQNEAQGYYYLTPKGVVAPGYDVMVSFWQQGNTTSVQVYDMNGNALGTDDAHDLLTAINHAMAQ